MSPLFLHMGRLFYLYKYMDTHYTQYYLCITCIWSVYYCKPWVMHNLSPTLKVITGDMQL